MLSVSPVKSTDAKKDRGSFYEASSVVITGVRKICHNTLRNMEHLPPIQLLPGSYNMIHISEAEDFVRSFLLVNFFKKEFKERVCS